MSSPTLATATGTAESQGFDSSYRCCICGHILPFHPAFCVEDTCPDCDARLWCFQRDNNGKVVLEVLPGRTPGVEDIDWLCRRLRSRGEVLHVVVDLSGLDLVNSALVAMLVLLNKRIQAAEGALQLCGLNQIVREIFHRFKLDTILDIIECETDPAL